MPWYLVFYLAVANLTAFFVYGADKLKARKGDFRISERTLLGLAIIGGSAGALAGMYFFHHKTRKVKFTLGVPAILILQILIFWRSFYE